MKEIRIVRLIGLITLLLLLTPFPAMLQQQLCPDLVNRALTVTDDVCDDTRRDQACYGHGLVRIDAQTQTSFDPTQFELPGDKAALSAIQNIHLSPMDTQAGVWGVSLMRLRAGAVQDNVLGNITLLAFGDVFIQNAVTDIPALEVVSSGSDALTPYYQPMQAFYFRSSDSTSTCTEIPSSGILIQTAEGMGQLRLTINGVDVEIGSTAFFQAQPDGAMTVSLVEGQTTLTAMGVSQTLLPGTQTVIPLDGNLAALGAPAAPVPFDEAVINALPLQLLDRPVQITNTLQTTVMLEGPVQSITGNTVTVYGMPVQLAPDDPLLTTLQTGDFINVDGYFDGSGTTAVLVVVNVSVINTVVISGNPGGTGNPANTGNPPNPGGGNAPTNGSEDGMGMGMGMGMGDDDDDD